MITHTLAWRAAGHAALFLWAIFTILSYWNTWSIDASALYFSAHFYDLGQMGLVYSPEPTFIMEAPAPEWLALAKAQSEHVGKFSPYVYPPLWAALLAPIAGSLTVLEFFNAVNVVNISATVAAVYLSYGVLRPQKISFTLYALIAVALLHFTLIGEMAIEFGQPQIFVTFLIVAAFWALQSGQPRVAGAVLGLAAAIKIAPGYLAIIFVMERRWRALAVFLAVCIGFAGLSFMLAGLGLHEAFLLRVRDLNSNVLVSQINLTVESVLVLMTGWSHDAMNWDGLQQLQGRTWFVQDKPGWAAWINKVVLGLGLGVTYLLTRQLPDGQRIWFRLHLVFLITLISSPLAWTHYLYLSILLLPGLLSIAGNRFATLFLLCFSVIFSSELYWFLVPFDHAASIQILSGFAVVLIVILALLWQAVRLGRIVATTGS